MELTLPASEFKAKCLDILKRLRDRKLDRVVVTHRGKAVAVLGPVAAEVDEDWVAQLQRDMRGTVHLAPGMDLTGPIFDGVMEAEQGIVCHGE